MTRDFTDEPVAAASLDRILYAGRRAPSAGNSQGTDFLVLEGPVQTARYWDVTLPVEQRGGFRWPGLLRAPVLIVPFADAGAYLARYAEPDKAISGLGESESRWPVPYWTVDTAFAAMAMQLAAVDEGLGYLFFGIFLHESELLEVFGVPPELRPIGTIAVGHPAAGAGTKAGRSAGRPRRAADVVVHRGRW